MRDCKGEGGVKRFVWGEEITKSGESGVERRVYREEREWRGKS